MLSCGSCKTNQIQLQLHTNEKTNLLTIEIIHFIVHHLNKTRIFPNVASKPSDIITDFPIEVFYREK